MFFHPSEQVRGRALAPTAGAQAASAPKFATLAKGGVLEVQDIIDNEETASDDEGEVDAGQSSLLAENNDASTAAVADATAPAGAQETTSQVENKHSAKQRICSAEVRVCLTNFVEYLMSDIFFPDVLRRAFRGMRCQPRCAALS